MDIREMLAAIQKMFNDSGAENKALRDELSRRDKSLKQASEELDLLRGKLAARDKKISELEKYQAELKRDNSAMQAENDRLHDSLQRTGAEVARQKILLEEQAARLDEYANKYAEIERAFNMYRKLPENTRFALEGVFGAAANPTNFLSGALQEGHLESLFDYTASALNNAASPDETEILCQLIDFTFDAVNNGHREKTFARLDTKLGDDFDRDTMRKTSNSNQSGSVQNILLAGFKYINSGNVVKPSLVVLA